FGGRVMITGPEGKNDKPGGIAHRYPRRKADLDRLAACDMGAAQARRQGRRIVRDDQVARAEQPCKLGSRRIPHCAAGVDNQQLGRFPVVAVGGTHGCLSTRCSTLVDKATRIVSTISPAECSGRFRVNGSASGTASLCSGVSMSPGSMDRKPMRSA